MPDDKRNPTAGQGTALRSLREEVGSPVCRACGAVESRGIPHVHGCPEARDIHVREVRPGPRSDFDLIVKHVVRGAPLYLELKNGSRFVGVVVDYTENLLELDIGLIAFADIAFVSKSSIPHIGLVGR